MSRDFWKLSGGPAVLLSVSCGTSGPVGIYECPWNVGTATLELKTDGEAVRTDEKGQDIYDYVVEGERVRLFEKGQPHIRERLVLLLADSDLVFEESRAGGPRRCVRK
jgi:uncharacterized protein YodC (DUF2158 family)